MKGFLAGLGAGATVGLAVLGAALSLAPEVDPKTVRLAAERPVAGETGAPVAREQAETDRTACDDGPGADEVARTVVPSADPDAGELFARNVPIAPADRSVSADVAETPGEAEVPDVLADPADEAKADAGAIFAAAAPTEPADGSRARLERDEPATTAGSAPDAARIVAPERSAPPAGGGAKAAFLFAAAPADRAATTPPSGEAKREPGSGVAARIAVAAFLAEAHQDVRTEPQVEEAVAPTDAQRDEAADLPDTPPDVSMSAPATPLAVETDGTSPDPRAEILVRDLSEVAVARPPAGTAPGAESALPAFDSTVPDPSPPRLASGQLRRIAAEATGDTPEDATRPEPEPSDRRALIRNAAAEPPAGDMPLLAIVLVDTGEGEVIADLPLSVAIAADAKDAGARASAWRAAGQEIVAIPGLPAGQSESGAVSLFDATFEALPGAATVMAESEKGFAGGPAAANDIASRLAETGHGLIVRGSGLDPAAQAAERAGVPATRIFRRVDGSGRDARAIARFLDQAAFEARNRGAIVVIADSSVETAEALDRFLNSSRAATVSLVPVSAVLRAE